MSVREFSDGDVAQYWDAVPVLPREEARVRPAVVRPPRVAYERRVGMPTREGPSGRRMP
jgi:hypothetical protein